MKAAIFFEISYRALALSFFATAIWAAQPPTIFAAYALKIVGCVLAALFWFLAERERRKHMA